MSMMTAAVNVNRSPKVVRRRETAADDQLDDNGTTQGTSGAVVLNPATEGKEKPQKWIYREIEKWERRSPMIKKLGDQVRRVPPSLRILFVIFWLIFKSAQIFIILWVAKAGTSSTTIAANPKGGHGRDPASAGYNPAGDDDKVAAPTKVLYIVTALAEYDNGHRATVKGRDRLGELMLPCIVDSIESMMSHPYDFDVDLYLILAFKLKPERKKLIEDRLPEGVGLEVWDDSCPLGYDKKSSGRSKKVVDNTRALARQHRFVIKDKLYDYDIFLPFEDDMRVTGMHVQHFIKMSEEIDRLRRQAPQTLPGVPENMDGRQMKFYGGMTEDQLKRVVPGFIRVEVLVNETLNGAQHNLDPIPVDYRWDGDNLDHHIDPSICCHVPDLKPNAGTPPLPKASDVVIWETSAVGLSLRHMPDSHLFDWVVLMPGPGKRMNKEELIGGYWTGRNEEFGNKEKPSGGVPELIAQQGGWMATRDQIIRMDEELCQGSFLPPFDEPLYYEDGQQSMNVEFWSGGYQYFTGVRGGCNMQRIISFSPEDFSKHFIYHMANNKQKQLNSERMLRADHLFGQLNTVLKKAKKDKQGAKGSK